MCVCVCVCACAQRIYNKILYRFRYTIDACAYECESHHEGMLMYSE